MRSRLPLDLPVRRLEALPPSLLQRRLDLVASHMKITTLMWCISPWRSLILPLALSSLPPRARFICSAEEFGLGSLSAMSDDFGMIRRGVDSHDGGDCSPIAVVLSFWRSVTSGRLVSPLVPQFSRADWNGIRFSPRTSGVVHPPLDAVYV